MLLETESSKEYSQLLYNISWVSWRSQSGDYKIYDTTLYSWRIWPSHCFPENTIHAVTKLLRKIIQWLFAERIRLYDVYWKIQLSNLHMYFCALLCKFWMTVHVPMCILCFDYRITEVERIQIHFCPLYMRMYSVEQLCIQMSG